MKRILLAVLLLFAATAGDALAWTYVVIDTQGHAHYLNRPPIDLTYPPDGVPSQTVFADDHTPPRGTPLTPQDERRRLNSGTLMIIDGASQQNSRDGWSTSNPEHALR
jgi:hypothetical protein